MLFKLFLTVEVHISFQPEVLFNIFSQGITNSLYTALFVLIPTIFLIVIFSKNFNALKPSKIELFLEMFVGGLFGLVESIMGEKNALKYFSFLLTFFVFILVSNWFPLLPGISSIGLVGEEEHTEETSVEYTATSNPEIIEDAEGGAVLSETSTVEEEIEPTFGCLLKGKCYLTTSGITTGSFKHMFRAPTADLSAGIALALISVLVTNFIGFKTNKLAY
ncbi:F0F1 ATP synthase subunit A, partial [Candidatus Dojkabacteria bacterium]|nr:F0F1 ATP synthase subunit A [Candidatus Dojkabacteria bacterium]